MPDIIELIKKWWKQMFVVIILSLLAVGIITSLKPREYLSIATAVPASSFAADKSKIFSDNIHDLYSALGNPDDLDMIVGTANLDTVYLAVTDEYNLFDHYKVSETGEAARNKAALLLKKSTRVMKSEYGELKIKVWDIDKDLAPQLANSITDRLQTIHQNLQAAGNEITLRGLIAGKEKLFRQLDSATTENRPIFQNRVAEYEKLITEYQLMVDNKPPVLIIVEKAKAASWPDKPRRMQIMIATAVLSFLFALFAALLLEKRKTT